MMLEGGGERERMGVVGEELGHFLRERDVGAKRNGFWLFPENYPRGFVTGWFT